MIKTLTDYSVLWVWVGSSQHGHSPRPWIIFTLGMPTNDRVYSTIEYTSLCFIFPRTQRAIKGWQVTFQDQSKFRRESHHLLRGILKMWIVITLMRMKLIEGMRVVHSPEGKLRSKYNKN